MTSFLDRPPPLDVSDPAVRDLWALLASTYDNKAAVRDLLAQAGIDASEVDFDGSSKDVWSSALRLAHRRQQLRGLLQLIVGGPDKAVGARITELLDAAPVVGAPAPPAAPDWKGAGGPGLEKIIQAQSTLLDVAFLRRGLELAASVCRLLVTFSSGRYYGTAFRIGADLLLTNHHVLFDHDHGNEQALEVEAWFGYERTFAGLDQAPLVLAGDVASIAGAADHDWAVVRLTGAMPADASVIALEGAPVPKVDDRVYIVQHPSGMPKKIGMIHNVVRFVDDDVVQYLTDTEGGSSGSPVFDEQWRLVALHHRWTEATVGATTEIRNQGQRIERVVEGLRAAGVV